MVDRLLLSYKDIFDNKESLPQWAVRKIVRPDELVRPAIPFVGKYFSKQANKILVYASAENLAAYHCGNEKFWAGNWLDDDFQAENRHRKCFDEDCFRSDSFFPNAHISPMNNGSLATAVYYVASRLFQTEHSSPRTFYETIAFANYGKYSIETDLQKSKRLKSDFGSAKANRDYAGQRALLAESHPYIRADIEILEPDCIIMPATMYKSDRDFITGLCENTLIIPIYQLNSGVINRIISRKYPPYDIHRLPSSVLGWYEHLEDGGMRGKTKENYLSVFTYLDQVIGHSMP